MGDVDNELKAKLANIIAESVLRNKKKKTLKKNVDRSILKKRAKAPATYMPPMEVLPPPPVIKEEVLMTPPPKKKSIGDKILSEVEDLKESVQRPVVKEAWSFKIKRDDYGNINEIVATPQSTIE